MTEAINHPEYYGGDDTYEVIKVLEAWDLELAKGFCWGNMIKYSARAGKKTSNEVQDRLKAEWYASRLATITATLEGRKATADARMERIRAGTEPGFTIATPGSIPEPPDARMWPQPGTEWIWEKDKPIGRCRVKVTKIGKALGNETVTCKVITRDPTGTCVIGTEVTNDLKRWFEATTPIPNWPYSWESAVMK